MSSLSIRDTGFVLLLLWVTGKALAFGKDLLVSYYFGASQLTDAYFVASNVPGLIYAGLHATVPLVLLPLYSARLARQGIASAGQLASGLLNAYLLSALALSVLVFSFSLNLVRLLAPSLTPETSELAASLTRIFAATFVFSMMSAVLTTIQLAHRQVFGTQAVPIVNNGIFILGVYLLSQQFGIYAAALSAAAAWLAQTPIQWLLVAKKFKYVMNWHLSRSEAYAVLALSAPALFSVSLDNLNLLVAIYFGSALPEGSISALSYALRVIGLFTGAFLVITTSLIYPEFARRVAADDIGTMRSAVDIVSRTLLLVSVPITLVVIRFSQELVSLLFERGAFQAPHVSVTADMVSLLAIAVPLMVLRDVYLRTIYAFRSPTYATTAGIAALSTTILTCYALVGIYGTNGLAVAIVLSTLVGCAVCYALVHAILRAWPSINFLWFCIKLAVLTLAASLVLFNLPVEERLDLGPVRLMVGFGATCLVFFLAYLALRMLPAQASSKR